MTEIVWTKVGDDVGFFDWQSNNMCIIDVSGKKVTLARFNERLYAFAWKCPHASGIMADGHINALGQVTCPLHRYRFDIQNGRNTSGEGYYLTTYPVEQREDGIYIGLKPSGFWSLF